MRYADHVQIGVFAKVFRNMIRMVCRRLDAKR